MVFQVSSNCRMFMLANALVQASGCVPDIICAAQITLKFIDHALIVYNWGLFLFRGKDLADLLRLKDWLDLHSKLWKWKKSSEDFQKQVVNEELNSKQAQLKIIREELRNIHDEIRLNCSTIRRVAIIRTLSTLQKNQYKSLMKVHAKKLTHLIDKKVDIDKHINNLSSYHRSVVLRETFPLQRTTIHSTSANISSRYSSKLRKGLLETATIAFI